MNITPCKLSSFLADICNILHARTHLCTTVWIFYVLPWPNTILKLQYMLTIVLFPIVLNKGKSKRRRRKIRRKERRKRRRRREGGGKEGKRKRKWRENKEEEWFSQLLDSQKYKKPAIWANSNLHVYMYLPLSSRKIRYPPMHCLWQSLPHTRCRLTEY